MEGGGHVGVPFKNTSSSQNKTVFDNTHFLLQLIWFCYKPYLKQFASIFHSIKHFDVHKFIAFCDLRDSHNYDDQLLDN